MKFGVITLFTKRREICAQFPPLIRKNEKETLPLLGTSNGTKKENHSEREDWRGKAKVKFSIMTKAMANFGSNLSTSEAKKLKEDVILAGLADMGAQTNSAGLAFLEKT